LCHNATGLTSTTGGNGKLTIFEGASFGPLHMIGFSGVTLTTSAAIPQAYIGYGSGALGVVDMSTARKLRGMPFDGIPNRARTSLFVPDLRRFYLAVPHRGNSPRRFAYTKRSCKLT